MVVSEIEGVDEAVVERARVLAVRVLEAADEIEALRRLPPQLAAAMGDAGLFSMYLSRAHGGPEKHPLAALRAVEMGCDVLLKGTQVDGVYSADPKKVPDAERFDRLTYQDVLSRDLKLMDTSAIALARENDVPILVFCIQNPGAFADVVTGGGTYTEISAKA